jgi:hypothetical protein
MYDSMYWNACRLVSSRSTTAAFDRNGCLIVITRLSGRAVTKMSSDGNAAAIMHIAFGRLSITRFRPLRKPIATIFRSSTAKSVCASQQHDVTLASTRMKSSRVTPLRSDDPFWQIKTWSFVQKAGNWIRVTFNGARNLLNELCPLK